MTKRQAKVYAHHQAWQILESAVTAGCEMQMDVDSEDFKKVIAAMDEIIQYHFERSQGTDAARAAKG